MPAMGFAFLNAFEFSLSGFWWAVQYQPWGLPFLKNASFWGVDFSKKKNVDPTQQKKVAIFFRKKSWKINYDIITCCKLSMVEFFRFFFPVLLLCCVLG